MSWCSTTLQAFDCGSTSFPNEIKCLSSTFSETLHCILYLWYSECVRVVRIFFFIFLKTEFTIRRVFKTMTVPMKVADLIMADLVVMLCQNAGNVTLGLLSL